ncbi:hypothetical protein PMAYCL1PPCAC_19863, partial [Pristionchus mayeri]
IHPNLPILVALGFFLVVVPTVIATTIVFHNKKRCRTILMSTNYTLSVKYQLEENMRAFKFLEFILFWGVVSISASGTVLLIASIFKHEGNVVCICGAAYEMFAMISFAGGASTIVLSQPPWRIALMMKLRRFQRRFFCHHSKVDSDVSSSSAFRLPQSLREART